MAAITPYARVAPDPPVLGDLHNCASEPKRLTLYDGGHVPSIEVLMSSTSAWLDQYLGRVGR